MGNLFHPDAPLMRRLEHLADLIVLNLLFLCCCVPVITVGPSLAALCSVARGMARGDWPPVSRSFFRAFRANFRSALLLFLALLLPAALAALYLILSASGGLDGNPLLKYLCWIAVALVGFVCSYAYPLLINFENTLSGTLKNAVILPLASPLLAVLITGLNLLPLLLLLLAPALFARIWLFWPLLGCAVTALIDARLLGAFFRRLSPTQKQDGERTTEPGEEDPN